jgi:hypothetical protein
MQSGSVPQRSGPKLQAIPSCAIAALAYENLVLPPYWRGGQSIAKAVCTWSFCAADTGDSLEVYM